MADWRQLVRLSDAELARCDVAEVNLACAAGLPGTERLDVPQCLRTLEEWTDKVRWCTLKNFRRFKANPGDYYYSEPYFRALCLVTALQRDCGVAYDPAKIPDGAPFEPADGFLFGLLQTRRGTCATLPVLCAAVGRRLGYPLRLAQAKGKNATHLFVRWDNLPQHQFNIEATDTGLRCPSDEYYRTGRYEITPDIERKGGFLQSLTPREELAGFLAERSCYWKDVRGHRHAAEAMAWASAMAPANRFFFDTLEITLNDWSRDLENRKPQGFPEIYNNAPRRRFPMGLWPDFERHLLGLQATEHLLNHAELARNGWLLRPRGERFYEKVSAAIFDFSPTGVCHIRLRFASAPRRSFEIGW